MTRDRFTTRRPGYQRRRSMRTTSTIMMMSTTVPIPIYTGLFLPAAACEGGMPDIRCQPDHGGAASVYEPPRVHAGWECPGFLKPYLTVLAPS